MSFGVVVNGSTARACGEFVPQLVQDRVASRIGGKDFTLWGVEAEAESKIRLGWVSSPEESLALVERIIGLREEFLSKGVDRFVLCGMGGSSLAPEVITKTERRSLTVLDSTNPEQVARALAGDLSRTAVVVSSKSGSTVETDSQKRLFEKAFDDAGLDRTDRMVIVTDPGSAMELSARESGYRVFSADPTVGGRYSALTAFGLVPSGLAGCDIHELLSDAIAALDTLTRDESSNPGLMLGAVLAGTRNKDVHADKVLIIEDGTQIRGLGDWAEQLIAESTGKLGKGVLPIVADRSSPEVSAQHEDVVIARLVGSHSEANEDEVSIFGTMGEQLLLWEFATVIASRIIGINPFDQPDVESAKIAARGMLEARSPELPADFIEEGIEVRSHGFTAEGESGIAGTIDKLLSLLAADGYVSIHAYLDREGSPEFASLRNIFAEKSGRPTTFGWAPRFLHSTGQYHKGGPKQGVFLQLVASSENDIAVPGRDFTLGELMASQAAGDAKVLSEQGSPVLTLSFSDADLALQILSKIATA